MLQRIICPCGNEGITKTERLPRKLRCSRCGMSRYVEPDRDARIVSTERRIENVNALAAAFRNIP
jgi:hypothetical protein